MRHDRNFKLVRLIPVKKVTSGTVSAGTNGSGGKVSIGIADTQGYDRCRIEITKKSIPGANTKLVKFHLYFCSGATTLAASGNLFSGYTSGIVLSAKTGTANIYGMEFDLSRLGNRKRYMGCKYQHSGSSAHLEVRAYLLRGEQAPPPSPVSTTTFSYTSYTVIS